MSARGRGAASTPERDGGFALLVALLALVALSILAAAGAVAVRSDGRITGSHRATVEARELARSGLSEYLARARPAAGPVSGRVFVHGGDTAAVTPSRLLYVDPDSSRTLLRLVSRGVRTRPGRSNAERTESVVVLRESGRIRPRGALTSALPVRVAGPGVTLSGDAACGGGGSPPPGTVATAGLAVPPGGPSGDAPAVDGDPPVDDADPGPVLLRESGVDSATWASLRDPDRSAPDRLVPGAGWPTDAGGWPFVLVTGDRVLGGAESGRGTILATGDLSLTGGFRWEGMILVGGSLAADGAGVEVAGTVVAGVDARSGAGGDSVTLAGTTEVRYDPCAVERAAARLFGLLAEVPGTRHAPGSE